MVKLLVLSDITVSTLVKLNIGMRNINYFLLFIVILLFWLSVVEVVRLLAGHVYSQLNTPLILFLAASLCNQLERKRMLEQSCRLAHVFFYL